MNATVSAFILLLLIPVAGARADEWDMEFYGGGHASQPIISIDMDPRSNLNSAFRIAARENRETDLEKLIQQGADVNSRSDYGETALMYAARNCSPRSVEFLLKSSAGVNLRDQEGRTPLIYAAQGSCVPVVGLLLRARGVDPWVRDRSGLTALDHARDNAIVEVDGPSDLIVNMIRSRRKKH